MTANLLHYLQLLAIGIALGALITIVCQQRDRDR